MGHVAIVVEGTELVTFAEDFRARVNACDAVAHLQIDSPPSGKLRGRFSVIIRRAGECR